MATAAFGDRPRVFSGAWFTAVLASLLSSSLLVAAPEAAEEDASTGQPNAQAVAAQVDQLILSELHRAGVEPAPRASDEDFLRRVCLDLAGRLPTRQEITWFCLDPDPQKYAAKVDELLASDQYAEHWARYWRDVIFTDPMNRQARLGRDAFEQWMAERLKQNRPWKTIAAELITATGEVRENGATALILACGGQSEEIAAEVSRIFLGIQLACANCHDHPSDIWKREQFHQLAAYFPRVSLRQTVVDGQPTLMVSSVNPIGSRFGDQLRLNPEQFVARMDRNGDGKVSKDEVARLPRFAAVFEALLAQGDSDKDGSLSVAELKRLPPPQQQGRGSAEYFMPDLNNPRSRGKLMHPAFFVDGSPESPGLDDQARRVALSEKVTSPENPWFARAMVNRMWNELLGEGFYMPVDDLGPERQPRHPEALAALSEAFTASGYDLKWLLRTITSTQAYQRQARSREPGDESPPFAAVLPTRLRVDQLYTALTQVLELGDLNASTRLRGMGPGQRSSRALFQQLFAVDPSVPHEDVTGNVPQALFMMNSPMLHALTQARGNTRLARLLRDLPADGEAIDELYFAVLCREPSERERQICLDYIAQVGNRAEAFEDLLRSLLNSTEFVTRR